MTRKIEMNVFLVKCAFLTVVATVFSTGCAATRYSSKETLANVRPAETLVRSFYVEHVDGKISIPHEGFLLAQTISIDPSDVDRILRERYPVSFNRRDGAVPLHVYCRGRVPPAGSELLEMDLNLLFWRYHEKGKIEVELLLDDAGAKRKVFVPFNKSRTESLLFLPLLLPDKRDWPTVFGNVENANAARTVFTELVASGIVKALNRATPEEMDKLVARAHSTEEQRTVREWLFSTTNTTFSVDESANLFAEVEHVYRPIPVDYVEKAKLPEILEQSFSADSRTGRLVADATGCDPELVADYLLVRLVPAICRTKGVVFDPAKTPPGGATYRITASSQESDDGKDLFKIEFESLQ